TAPLSPRSAAAFVMIDCAAHHDPTDELATVVGDLDGVMALGPQRDLLYRIRDHVTIAIGALGTPLKLDVAVPVQRLPDLDALVTSVAAELGARSIVFGHLAEGNVHVNLLGTGTSGAAVTDRILAAVIDMGGTISAEHGIGVAKTVWLERLKGAAALAAMRAVKAALDPNGVLNPGVLLP
ncbi:MAG: FAD-linked oxidase C-terminal domain-containing protein, partial [Actinomycetota bacterium]